jgi:proteasome activator subunit 2 (PA28 beta)
LPRQEETVGELGRAEDACFQNLESISKYFIARARLITRVLKNPHVQDFLHSIVGALCL